MGSIFVVTVLLKESFRKLEMRLVRSLKIFTYTDINNFFL